MFLLVPAYPGCPGQTAVKWLLLLLLCVDADDEVSEGEMQQVQQLTEMLHAHVHSTDVPVSEAVNTEYSAVKGALIRVVVVGFTVGFAGKYHEHQGSSR